MYRHAKPVEWCQCYAGRIALADAHSVADFFGYNDASEVIYPTDNPCGFHIYKSPCYKFDVLLLFVNLGDLYVH